METKTKKNTFIRVSYPACLIIIVVLIVTSVLIITHGNISALSFGDIKTISVDLTGMMLCGILLFSLFNSRPWDVENRALFRLIATLALLFHVEIAAVFLEGNPSGNFLNLLCNTFLYFWETLIIFCFWGYIRREIEIKKKVLSFLIIICRIALIAELVTDLLNMRLGFFFTINSLGHFTEGIFYNQLDFIDFVICIAIWYVILQSKTCSVKKKLILLSFQIFPIIAHVLAFIYHDYSLVYPAYLLSLMLIYINVFAVKSNMILEQKLKLDEQKTALMVSQIQPHFLYNVLTTISNLCVTDPEEAEETTVLFAQYLRTNLDSLQSSNPVPFQTELGHIRTYTELEKKRFGDKIRVEIDCPETGFFVPALGLQPIVENSIKHGIRGKDTPGLIRITSRKVNSGYQVIIEDDGIGFDPHAPLPDDGKSHVGLKNVKERLEHICQARVTVESSPGKGCKTTIFFPEQHLEDDPDRTIRQSR